MSLSFFKKAFGIKRIGENREFDDFLRYFERPDVVGFGRAGRSLKRKAFRFIVIGYEGRKTYFDSLSYKDSPRPLPTFVVGSQKISLTEFVFGSFSLRTSKELLYSVKVHDFSSTGQILITRFLNDLDDWRCAQMMGRRFFGNRRFCSSSVPQLPARSEPSLHNSVVACLLINIDQAVNHFPGTLVHKPPPPGPVLAGVRRGLSQSTADDKSTSSSQTISNPKMSEASPRRFYRALFEHCAFLSVLLESLVSESFTAISKVVKSQWDSTGLLTEAECCDIIASAYASFLTSFLDFCAPRLSFPVWPSLNNVLTIAPETSSFDDIRGVHITSWLNTTLDTPVFPGAHGTVDHSTHASLANLFLRGCFNPLVSRGGEEHRYFLSQIITGVLILHPGWVTNLIASSSTDSAVHPSPTLHTSGCVSLPNIILNQLLLQIGCTEVNQECLSGSIFNCTILSGQSKKYLSALLYFVTYFLRFTSVMATNESLPDLGRADLFELEQHRKQSRSGNKTRRKSGSAAAISGDSHDSGISSQEDLAVSVYSASTGSSPTHASGMALCMPNRLTRDQCLIAQLAAQRMVSQEAAAAAGGTHHPHSSLRLTTDLGHTYDSGFPHSTSSNSSHSRCTEIPLLIEKFVEDETELCACLSAEVYPGQNSSPWSSDPPSSPGASSLSKSVSDTSPALAIAAGSSRASCATSPRSNASSLGASNSKPMDSQVSRKSSRQESKPSFRTTELPAYPQITNHSLIGNSVLERYCSGLALQATSESIESFKERVCQHLHQWLQLGPLVIRGMNLSTRKPHVRQKLDSHIGGLGRNKNRVPELSASSLLVNADSRTVEILTFRRPSSYITKEEGGSPSLISAQTRAVRHSFSHSNTQSSDPTDFDREFSTPNTSSLSENSKPKRVNPSPMVMQMLGHVVSTYDRTNCPSLVLRDLEGSLRLIYSKSRIIADLISKMGYSVLRKTDWMACIAGCSPDDIPLLLATAASYSLPAALVLHQHHSDWWIG